MSAGRVAAKRVRCGGSDQIAIIFAMRTRVAVALVSVLVIAWTAVLIRDVRIGDAAAELAFTPNHSDREFDHAMTRLTDAQLLNPDRHWALLRVVYLQGSNRPEQASRETQRFLRAEPDSLTAWAVLLRASTGLDPGLATRAKMEIHRLSPLARLPG
jgi:hypothetical protein